MHFFKWLERTYPTNGKTINANSVKEEALSIVDAALARFDGMLGANRQLALAA